LQFCFSCGNFGRRFGGKDGYGEKTLFLIFEGKLVAGFDKETLLKNLSRMYKKDETVLKRKFFAGKRLIVLKTEDKNKADRVLKGLKRAGAEITIREVLESPAPPKQEPAAGPTPPSSQSGKKKRRWPLFPVSGGVFGFRI